MNSFLVVETVQLNVIHRFALTGAVRQGVITAGMCVHHPDLGDDSDLEIMKVDLLRRGEQEDEHNVALMLRLDDVMQHGLNKPELWIGKEVMCK